jgi:hypothetical protein
MATIAAPEVEYSAITNLTRDLKKDAVTLSRDEARFLVDNYYLMQEQRIRTAAQVRSMGESGELHDVLKWFNGQSDILDSEPGTNLKATGWVCEKTGCGGTPQGKRTNRPNGHEVTPVTFVTKQRWAKLL